jgi:energy-coupling factor transporter ATP-binding protein EcfA2
MKKLHINLENCYGIGKLNHCFDFTDNHCYLVYAPNGTMKSSLAKTFNDISKNDKKTIPCDRIYKERKTSCDILVDKSPIDPSTILVVDAEDSKFDASHKITNFIASKDLKEQYDKIYS